ncbi:hypothetical protein EJB05_48183, partial [Eragrostis curvula]
MGNLEPEETRDWTALPYDILCEILCRTRQVDILCGAELACTAWRRVAAHEPAVWRCIDVRFEEDEHVTEHLYLERLAMGRAAVDRSAGRSPSLRSLYVTSIWCLPEAFEDRVIAKLPMLEELVPCGGLLLQSNLRALLKHCPRLQLLETGECFIDTQLDYDLRQMCTKQIKDFSVMGICPVCYSWTCRFEKNLQEIGEGVDIEIYGVCKYYI